MTGEKRPDINVNQDIKGNGHQVAGNDIHNHMRIDEFKPSGETPLLRECKACHWPGVAVNAAECGKCGYSYAEERVFTAEHQRREKELFIYWFGVAALAVLIGAVATAHATSLGLFDAMAVSAAGVLAAWCGWTWLCTWCSVKLNRFLGSRDK